MREQLIALGKRLFAEKGFHGTGLKEILEVGQVPKGSFYNYFESKEAFAAEVVDAYSAEVMEVFDVVVAKHADAPPVERVRAFHDVLRKKHAKDGWRHGCLLGSFAGEIAGSSDACSEAIRRGALAWRERVAALFAEGQKRNEVRKDVPASELAEHFWNAWQGALLRMQIDRSGKGLAQTVDLTLGRFILPSAKGTRR